MSVSVINNFEGRSAVLSGEILLDPLYLAEIACILKVFGITAYLNKIDYLYLQVLHGGDFPISGEGVASIDVDAEYQDEMVEDNLVKLRDKINPIIKILSERGSLALTNGLIELGLIKLYRMYDQYFDGINFITTGNVNEFDGTLHGAKKLASLYQGQSSLLSDIQKDTPDSHHWQEMIDEIPVKYNLNLDPLRVTQL